MAAIRATTALGRARIRRPVKRKQLDAGRLEVGVQDVVVLVSGRVPMGGVRVDLDRQLGLREVGVHLLAHDRDVGVETDELRAPQQPDQQALVAASG